VGEPEGNRPLGISRSRSEDDIKMDLQKLGCGGMDRLKLAQYRDRCECGNEHSGSINTGNFLTS
jgi:hypothetical protein